MFCSMRSGKHCDINLGSEACGDNEASDLQKMQKEGKNQKYTVNGEEW